MYNYSTNPENSQIYNKTLIFLLFSFIFSLFFPIRHIFTTEEAFLTHQYSDFTSFSLYLSDILLFILAIFVIVSHGKNFWLKIKQFNSPISYLLIPIFCLILWVSIGFLIYSPLNIRFSSYFLLKWLELIVAYGTFGIVFQEIGLRKMFLRLFVWFCAFQSVLALVQFAKQSSLGLYKLGESHLGPSILGVAKIVSGGTTFIRGYGTFPHPNPLSAFLVAGILIGIYLLMKSESLKAKIAYSILVFLNILGLTVSFSRGAYLALAVGLIVLFGSLIVIARSEATKQSNSEIATLTTFGGSLAMTSMVVVSSIIISFFLFHPFLLTRATLTDQSIIDRKFYNEVGLEMVKKNPFFGVGIGESVLHMEQYSGKSLRPWEKQPPHNYFILAATELGIPGMLILLWIFLSHLGSIIKKLKPERNLLLVTCYLLLAIILCTFLVLMQFDHYFYTLQQTQLLLWILLGVIAAQTKNPSYEGLPNS